MDTVSPQLFTACLENIFRWIEWKGITVNRSREYLNHKWFAVNIWLISELSNDFQKGLNDMNKKIQSRFSKEYIRFFIDSSKNDEPNLNCRNVRNTCIDCHLYIIFYFEILLSWISSDEETERTKKKKRETKREGKRNGERESRKRMRVKKK